MRKSDATVLLAVAVGSMLFTGCSASSTPISELPDGQYTGQSAPETEG